MLTMRRILVCLLICVSVMVGCKKEEKPAVEPDNRPNSEKIIGKWSVALDKSYLQYTEPGYEQMDLYCETANEMTITFDKEGMLHYYCSKGSGYDEWVDEWSDPYVVEGDTLKWDVFNYHISELNSTTLVMESVRSEEITRSNGSTYETREVRHYEMERLD